MFGPPEEGALIKIVGGSRLDRALKDYLGYYRTHHARLARLYPGMREILDLVRSKHRKMALFTGKGTFTTSITLEEFDLQPYFDLVVTGNDVQKHKPSAEGILKILDRFDLEPAQALMVGDSVADVKASREAGVAMAAVLWDSYARERVEALETDFRFYDIPTFHSWLGERLDSASSE